MAEKEKKGYVRAEIGASPFKSLGKGGDDEMGPGAQGGKKPTKVIK